MRLEMPTYFAPFGLVKDRCCCVSAKLLLFAFIMHWGANDARTETRKTLDIYVIDVEGGNAVLFVSPSGESALIDTGNLIHQAAIRDAERIMAAVKDAGVTR